jgi:chemotaxis protein histidine kinase CheA
MLSLSDFERLIGSAESAVEDLREEFHKELAACLGQLRQDWTAMAASGDISATPPAVDLQTCFDLTHQIKSMGGTFDFDLVSDIAASLCELLQDLQSRPVSAKARDAVERHIAALELVEAKKLRGDGGPFGRQLVTGLTETRQACLID